MISPARRIDPTQTSGIVRLYAAEIRRRLRRLELAIRVSILERDALGLEKTRLKINEDIEPAGYREWAALEAAERARRVRDWLETAIATGVLESAGVDIPAWLKSYVRAAYAKGVQSATAAVGPEGVDLDVISENINAILSMPFHRDQLDALYMRNLTELKGMTEALATGIQRVIADGLMTGAGPREIARAISRQFKISRKRALVIARTETIRANAEAQLRTFERFGLAEVEVMAEWITAQDGRVCPRCAPLDGRVFTIDEARGMIPQHPNCRCSWVPLQVQKVATSAA